MVRATWTTLPQDIVEALECSPVSHRRVRSVGRSRRSSPGARRRLPDVVVAGDRDDRWLRPGRDQLPPARRELGAVDELILDERRGEIVDPGIQFVRPGTLASTAPDTGRRRARPASCTIA